MSATETGKAAKLALFVALVAGGVTFALLRPGLLELPIPHAFADARRVRGIPNAYDVLSSGLLLLVGLAGLSFLARGPSLDPDGSFRPGAHTAFDSYRERPAYAIFFSALVLVAVAAAFYHLSPTAPRLFWLRLPIAIAVTSLFAIVLAERVSIYWSRNLLLPLLFAAVASVVVWRISEQQGASDPRPYFVLVGASLASLPLLAFLFRSRYTHGWMLLVGLALLVGAVALARLDAHVLRVDGGVISGHSLAHVMCALAAYSVVAMLRRRGLALAARERPAYLLDEDEENGQDAPRTGAGEE